ncbi:protein cII [Aliivibrio finisterrensis]|uniref:sce7726 family protein n=1 Tax=Aliivibrio finisterrensis TaxID=511998 RepID=UPI0010220DAF|nr:sce7726 family protein [Aliivibrio finisterrensis]RYU56043.1 protein cII [Aliivibrio finisterrensis]RYU61144.1 protein cII [Aliivibrio finisterrensis]RYU68307.1 protein cII [Aliivibrio finisterrensis]RYU68990.1 protein cII [Aliivibrio finisterrensis]RYU71782.1 protein cII [Aliivibrio finisterrensis]
MTELEIKKLLIRYFLENYESFVVGSEFSFQFGERRADLALLKAGYLTAFEIKGARDTVSRLSDQIESYKNFFDFCFVVCEASNLAEVRVTISRDVGILLAGSDGITHVRQSKQFKRHDKRVLSSALSVQKLTALSKGCNLRSKHELCEYVSKNNTLESLRQLSRSDFNERYEVASKLLKQETTLHLTSDDIHTITKKAPSLLKRRIG